MYRSTFRVNTATDGGGGIYASNAVTLTQSPVVSNTAGGAGGGGIYANNAVTLTGSPVIINTATGGGGIYASAAVTLTDSPVSENTAAFGGGGLAAHSTVLSNSAVLGNTASVGGGISTSGSLSLTNSAVLSNTASGGPGGGIYTMGSLSLTNSTLSANSAATDGGAIDGTGSLTASFSTISANSARNGGGIARYQALVGPPLGPTTLKATILAGNTAPSAPDTDCAGPVTSLGDNLIGDADGCSAFSAPGDLTGSGAHPLDPGLDALADNGGPTLTQALLPGSPAINHVPAARCTDASGTPVTSDQSGVDRPDPGDLSGVCDSGAYEYDGGPVILGVAPNSGPVAGGTQVVIRGTDLEGMGPLSVTFGGIAATNVSTDPSGRLITVTTPAHAAGTVDVAVAVLVEGSVITTPVTPADQFTYGVPSTPTSTPTSGATAAPPHGLVPISTATATPARPGASATRVPASPCRRALPLHVRLSSGTVRSAGTVSISARTVSRARLSVVVRVLAHKTVVTGRGTHRRRVVRTIALYRASATGRADARGRYNGKLHVTYKAAKQTRALLTVTARTGCTATTATLRMTILPRRQH